MTDMITNTNVFTYIGVTSPTASQTAMMTVVRKGIEGSIRNYCNWQITSESFIFIMPKSGAAYYDNVWTSQRVNRANVATRSRMQLPVPYVSEIITVHENFSAHGGKVADDFSDDHLLTDGDDYFLDIESTPGSESAFSKAGGIIRVNRNWSSVAATIRVECTSGFDSSDFDSGEAEGLKNWIISKCADVFMFQSRKAAMMFSSATGGLVVREKLGDYEVSYRGVFDSGAEGSGRGLTNEDQEFLEESGLTFCATGV